MRLCSPLFFGLTVITGETGSGKTALLSAIKLLVGERADAATVREGVESAASVEGRLFFLRGVDAPDGHVAVRKAGVRTDAAAFLMDGSMATVVRAASPHRIGTVRLVRPA